MGLIPLATSWVPAKRRPLLANVKLFENSVCEESIGNAP
jgi:hypothetical protein